jgi:hypothetical protein
VCDDILGLAGQIELFRLRPHGTDATSQFASIDPRHWVG